jgi:hypothetical protein
MNLITVDCRSVFFARRVLEIHGYLFVKKTCMLTIVHCAEVLLRELCKSVWILELDSF